MTTVNRQAVIDGLRGFGRQSAAQKLGMTPAQYTVHLLSTWEKRNGKPLSPHQAHVLACCRRMLGQSSSGEVAL